LKKKLDVNLLTQIKQRAVDFKKVNE